QEHAVSANEQPESR
nr:immunoglobulin heavy chain junction region [Homo sapiens]